MKFTPRRRQISTRPFIGDKGELYLQIIDTVIGISEDQLEMVLEPFGQPEARRNHQYEGTGFNLTLTQGQTELHGGQLEIRSESDGPDRETTVTAIFPASSVVT